MRILAVTQYFWPENFRFNDIVKGLVERGHEVVVLTGLPNYPEGRFARGYGLGGPYRQEFEGAIVKRVPMLARGNSPLSLFLNYLVFAFSASLFGPFRARGRFDAILVYEPSPITVGIPARLMGWLKRAPILFWVQDLWPESLSATGAVKNKTVLAWVEKLVRWVYRGCALVLVQSEAFVEPVRKLAVPAERIVYFPNGAEDFYQPIQRAAKWDGPALPDGFRVMFAGNIGVAQSFETILGAAGHLRDRPDIHWIIVGDGRQSDWVRQQVARRGLEGQFHLMGRFPVETMPKWFSQADAMLVSLKRDEIMALTVPAKVQSYLACGKPIIASLDGEGARIVALAGAGLTAPAEDAQALADAVVCLYEMSDAERQETGERGLKYFQTHFSRETLLDSLETWLREGRATETGH